MILPFALALALSVDAASAGAPCVQVEIAAAGRGAHGSAVMPASAPHLLIRALERLPAWSEATPAVDSIRIVGLAAAPVINIIPRRATAIVEVALSGPGLVTADLLAGLEERLGPQVEIQLLAAACPPAP